MEYYGRKIVDNSGKERKQLIIDHLKPTSIKTGNFTRAFSSYSTGEFTGLIHDIGKYSKEFQYRLDDPKIKAEHAAAGAYVCEELFKKTGFQLYRLIAFAVCGHHTGLQNFGSVRDLDSCVYSRLKGCKPEKFEAWKTEIDRLPEIDPKEIKLKSDKNTCGFTLQMLVRFIFSSLVDADRIDASEAFGEVHEFKNMTLQEYTAILDEHMRKFEVDSELNRIRAGINAECISSANGEKGIYTLEVPTGGGKTLAFLSFALNHAIKNKCSRIIYSIPFMSIIEQNAAVFSKIFGRNNVLEHHSNFKNPFEKYNDDQDERAEKLRRAEENWDMPLVVTTNVQFFESLFSGKPSRARKLHNIANSVIILDEAQSIPVEYLRPCMLALYELVRNYGCSVVLCTATQPEFDKNKVFPEGVPIKHIIKDSEVLYEQLKRVDGSFKGKLTLEELSEELGKEKQVLCIVNTKKHAQKLYRLQKETGYTFHLSANMYPQHRRIVLRKIKRLLKAGLPCRVISTQLIEAGVDIDFSVVYRSLAGIDSIAQAAGRCNREGKLEGMGKLYVFEPESEFIGKGFLGLTAGIGKEIISRFENFLGKAAVEEYYRRLFDQKKNNMDKAEILESCEKHKEDMKFEFEEMDKNFKLIQESGYSVIVPATKRARKLIRMAGYGTNLKSILRQLSPYSISIPEYAYRKLMEKDRNAVYLEHNFLRVLDYERFYDRNFGLVIDGEAFEVDYIV